MAQDTWLAGLEAGLTWSTLGCSVVLVSFFTTDRFLCTRLLVCTADRSSSIGFCSPGPGGGGGGGGGSRAAAAAADVARGAAGPNRLSAACTAGDGRADSGGPTTDDIRLDAGRAEGTIRTRLAVMLRRRRTDMAQTLGLTENLERMVLVH